MISIVSYTISGCTQFSTGKTHRDGLLFLLHSFSLSLFLLVFFFFLLSILRNRQKKHLKCNPICMFLNFYTQADTSNWKWNFIFLSNTCKRRYKLVNWPLNQIKRSVIFAILLIIILEKISKSATCILQEYYFKPHGNSEVTQLLHWQTLVSFF